ncbi:DUF1800 domain-containing protein [Rhizobium tumorigenes]|uniref:DUF1800 domain-containing protein n=1 Tax=Rhizobium tumorigenes TaxID=2041385 RepID=UPI00241FF838|nr:DUF1800 domain-containing protein [Rhizobium tumorigenes]WFS02611.1 DUF1800 domain-containing protein [Rhizobium tumorigenes]
MSISFQTMAALRFGTGLRPGEPPPADKQALLAEIRDGIASPPLFPVGGLDARRKAVADVADQLQAIRKGNDPDETKRARENAVYHRLDAIYQRDADARIAQAVFSSNGFYERLASFWVNHFSVSAQKSQQMRLIVPLFEAEAIRPNIGAPFPVLLKAVTRHPAMLIYLDQSQSLGPNSPAGLKQKKGLNENLARELIELDTLGAGSGYTQADVRSAAMVLTGIALDRQAVSVDFKPGMSEPGSHDVLGVTYGGKVRRESDYLAMLDDLALHPKTAQHICRKLVAHFIADQPPQAMIDVMVDCWKNTKGDLTAVYATMLDHPDAWSGEGAKARSPFDFVVAGLRAFNIPRNPVAVSPPPQSLEVADATPPAAAAATMSPAGTPAMAPAPAKASAPVVAAPVAAAGVATMASGMSSGTTGAQMSPPGDIAADADAEAQRRKQEQAAFDATLYVPCGLGLYALRRMGEPVWEPPSPAGFPDSFDAWINASALSERLAWSCRAAGRYGKQDDPREFLKATLADAARDDTIRVVSQAPNRMTGLTLVLASPDFNRR